MFKVKSNFSGSPIHTVYDIYTVSFGENDSIWFLIYSHDFGWRWVYSSDYEPIEE